MQHREIKYLDFNLISILMIICSVKLHNFANFKLLFDQNCFKSIAYFFFLIKKINNFRVDF